MIFDNLPDLVVDDSLVQSASGRQQIRDCCHAAEADLAKGPTIRMFACDAGNDILLLLSALDYIERIEGDHKAIDALRQAGDGCLEATKAHGCNHCGHEGVPHTVDGAMTCADCGSQNLVRLVD